MKKTDLALIVVIALISIMASYFVLSSIIGPAEFGNEKVPTVEPINSEIIEPDLSIFNSDAINPAVEVNINPQSVTGQ